MLATFLGIQWPAWPQLLLGGVILAAWLVVRTVLLWGGAKYMAQLPNVRIGRCALAILLLAPMPLLIFWIWVLSSPAGPLAWLLTLLWGWSIIKRVFHTTYGKAVVAWIPTAASWMVAIPLLAAMILKVGGERGQITNGHLCLVNLYKLSTSCQLYLTNNADAYPPSLEVMVETTGYGLGLLRCPASSQEGASYFYLAPLAEKPRCLMACDFKWNHGGYRNVLFSDGRVEGMTAEQFAQELADPNNARFAQALAAAEGSLAPSRPSD